VFSDALDVKRTLEIKRVNEEEIGFQGSYLVRNALENGTDMGGCSIFRSGHFPNERFQIDVNWREIKSP
jgi:hypothetical protein